MTTEIPLSTPAINEVSRSAILEPSTSNNSLDISNQVTSVIENANSVRLKYINDFIIQLEKDYKKYGNKKRKLILIKNIIFGIDFLIGNVLIIVSIILQIVGYDSRLLSIIFCAIGSICISTLPLITKVAETQSNKNRNFETLTVKKLNMCKQIFSRSIEDGKVSHEELLEVFECKNQYENAKDALKTINQKETENLFNNGAMVLKNTGNVTKDNIKDKIDQMYRDAQKTGALPSSVTPNSYLYPSLNASTLNV